MPAQKAPGTCVLMRTIDALEPFTIEEAIHVSATTLPSSAAFTLAWTGVRWC